MPVLSNWEAVPISVRPHTAMQPTCSGGPIVVAGSNMRAFPCYHTSTVLSHTAMASR